MLRKTLSRLYTEKLQQCAIPESASKRIITEEPGSFEFCKRIFQHGVEITPLPWEALKLNPTDRYLEIGQLLRNRQSPEHM